MKTSKITLFLSALLLMILSFEGCKKDDPAPTPAEQLVGSWKEVSYVNSGCTDPLENETNTCTSGCETLVVTASTLTFSSPGKTQTIAYTADGNTLTVTVGTQITKVTFEITGTTLTITIQDSAADGNCKSVSTYSKV